MISDIHLLGVNVGVSSKPFGCSTASTAQEHTDLENKRTSCLVSNLQLDDSGYLRWPTSLPSRSRRFPLVRRHGSRVRAFLRPKQPPGDDVTGEPKTSEDPFAPRVNLGVSPDLLIRPMDLLPMGDKMRSFTKKDSTDFGTFWTKRFGCFVMPGYGCYILLFVVVFCSLINMFVYI